MYRTRRSAKHGRFVALPTQRSKAADEPPSALRHPSMRKHHAVGQGTEVEMPTHAVPVNKASKPTSSQSSQIPCPPCGWRLYDSSNLITLLFLHPFLKYPVHSPARYDTTPTLATGTIIATAAPLLSGARSQTESNVVVLVIVAVLQSLNWLS